MKPKTLKRNFFQRLFGISATKPPKNEKCWTYAHKKVILDLGMVPELRKAGSSIRIESDSLPERILVVHGLDGKFHAFRNKCSHSGQRLDPLPDKKALQCCGTSQSVYDYQGKVISGPAKTRLLTYTIRDENVSAKNITVFRNILETILSIDLR